MAHVEITIAKLVIEILTLCTLVSFKNGNNKIIFSIFNKKMDSIVKSLPKMIVLKNKEFFQEYFECFHGAINQSGFNLVFYLKNKSSVMINIKDRDVYFDLTDNGIEKIGIPLRKPL